MGSNMLPLFLPEGVNFDKLLRALIAVTLFSSAYMAEVVRGGLQAIPKGQYEGAMALGLSYWRIMGLIVLPQALKIVIPGIVSSFIGLFKDTTLVSIIGLFDLLLVGKSAITDTKWLRLAPETYGLCLRVPSTSASASACRAIARGWKRSCIPAINEANERGLKRDERNDRQLQ